MLYYFLRDQGGAIGGALALLAGGVAYFGAIRAAKIQGAAVIEQTAVLKAQNDALKREAQRTLAREGVITTRLLIGVVNRVREESNRLLELLDQDAYKPPSASAPSDWRLLIQKPHLSVVWNNLGRCGFEIVEKYLFLDAKIDEFATINISSASYMRERAMQFVDLAEFLLHELDCEAKRCNEILANGS